MKTHLVLGGCGFLGRHLALALAHRGDRVVVVGRNLFPDKDVPITSIICDLVSAHCTELDRLIAKADVIYHLAWSTIPATAQIYPAKDVIENVGMTVRILEALKRRGGGRIVFASSGGTVYGIIKCVPVSEQHPLNPITAYGLSKLTAERYLALYAAHHGIDARIARISNPYGPGQSTARPQGAVTTFVLNSLANIPINVWGDGNIIRDYIYISDLISALLKLADVSQPAQREHLVLNIGCGQGVSLNTIINILKKDFYLSTCVNYSLARQFDVPISVLDISRARSMLSWEPRVTLQQGIEKLVYAYSHCHGTANSV